MAAHLANVHGEACDGGDGHICGAPSAAFTQTLDELEFERGPWLPAQAGNIDKVRKMVLKNQGEVHRRDNAGYTALHYAARSGHPDAAELCLFLCDRGSDANATTSSGHVTPLQRAATAGRTAVVAALLSAGANVDLQDADGKTALIRAAEAGHAEVVRVLLQHGADVQILDANNRSANAAARGEAKSALV